MWRGHKFSVYGNTAELVFERFCVYRNSANAGRGHTMPDSNPTMQKKRGRPAIGQDPVLSVRMHRLYLETIDEWRHTEPDKPSRPEALRLIIAKGLEAAYNVRKK
jgi:hypothetical protein